MSERFSPHNLHWESPDIFFDQDPHLRRLKNITYVHRSELLKKLPMLQPGIYTISGARQVGKSTLMKQWMADLLNYDISPDRIAYFTGELIDDHHSLVKIFTETMEELPYSDIRYFILDEVTYIRDWDKGVKYLADAGLLERAVLILSGSDLAIIREARLRLPGRRGISDEVDFHLYPLDFRETIQLKNIFEPDVLKHLLMRKVYPDNEIMDVIFDAFDEYLIHGGFLTAINALAEYDYIPNSTFSTYSDWIRGDVLKRGKQERYLREVLGAIFKRYGSQVTWNALVKDLSIDHPNTIANYINLLESMDAVFVQYALSENNLNAAPKKARKVIFTDPFIFHSVRAWLSPVQNVYEQYVVSALNDPKLSSRLVEGCTTALYRRHYQTYYVKAHGEVDIAYVDGNHFHPIEIKWSGQLRPKDLKQIAKYPTGRILSKSRQYGNILGVPTEPLPLSLLRLGL
jgi:predicted AAA+ superfamily ATPase